MTTTNTEFLLPVDPDGVIARETRLLPGVYTGHDAATLPVDAYWGFVATHGAEPERIERTGGAVLAGPLPERGQGE